MARRKRRSPRRRVTRRRTYRRNQPRAFRGFAEQLTDGAVGAAQVITGKAVARVVPETLGLAKEGPTGLVTQAAVAVLVGMLGRQFFGAEAGKMMLIGGLTGPVESILITANIPIISPALSAYPMIPGVAAYPQVGVSAYPEADSDLLLGAGAGVY